MLWKSKQSKKHKIVYCYQLSTDPSEDRTLSERSVRRFFKLFLHHKSCMSRMFARIKKNGKTAARHMTFPTDHSWQTKGRHGGEECHDHHAMDVA